MIIVFLFFTAVLMAIFGISALVADFWFSGVFSDLDLDDEDDLE